MENKLYVANLADSVTEDHLTGLFAQHGDVKTVEFGTDEVYGVRYALIAMGSEKTANKANHALNGHILEGKALLISWADADLSKELMGKQRKAMEDIAAILGETEKVPLRQLEMLVRLCGTSFAQALLKEAQNLDEAGGLMTKDGARRRTLGGVLFELSKPAMSVPVRYLVITRKGKPPVAQSAEAENLESTESASTGS